MVRHSHLNGESNRDLSETENERAMCGACGAKRRSAIFQRSCRCEVTLRLLRNCRAETKKRTEHRIRSRYILHVPNVTESVLKNTQRGRRCGLGKVFQKPRNGRRISKLCAQNTIAAPLSNVISRTRSSLNVCINQSSRRPQWKRSTKLC